MRRIRAAKRCRSSRSARSAFIGLETALGVALEQLVHTGKINVARLVEMFTIGSGADSEDRRAARWRRARRGDVTIFSTDREWTYDVNKSFSKSRNSPFDGESFKGGPVATSSRQVVWQA